MTRRLLCSLPLLFALPATAQIEAKPGLDVPYVVSSDEAVKTMLKLARVTKKDIVYDLGCGDGRIVIAAAKLYGAHGVGIDLDPVRVAEAKVNAKKAGVEKLVRFEQGDLFKADFHQATVVTLFLLPQVNLKLRPRLLHDLKPGTRVVTNTFNMGADWKPAKEDYASDDIDELGLNYHMMLFLVPDQHR